VTAEPLDTGKGYWSWDWVNMAACIYNIITTNSWLHGNCLWIECMLWHSFSSNINPSFPLIHAPHHLETLRYT